MQTYAEGFDDFCRREHPRLVGALTLYTGDPELGAELAQEALARACRDWRTVSAMAAPGAWAHRVAMNLAKSRFARRAVERRAMRMSSSQVLTRSAHYDDRIADSVVLRSAVAALPARQREALVLRYFSDLPVAVTAEVMGCAPGTVKALTNQGIERLRAAGLVDSARGDDAVDGDEEEVSDGRH